MCGRYAIPDTGDILIRFTGVRDTIPIVVYRGTARRHGG
jgi:hypothetical protein